MAQKPLLRAEIYLRALRAGRNVKGAEIELQLELKQA
jgi:hypothetical protein